MLSSKSRTSIHVQNRAKSRKSNAKLPSVALAQAMSHVKDYMTENQKALVLLKEGKTLMENGDIKGALDCFNQGICFHPSVTLFNMRATCHKQLDNYQEAYYDYSFNIRMEPDVGAHYCNRGLCLARLKKVELAIEDLDTAISLDPVAGHYYCRATVNADFGRGEEAVNDFTTALKEESSNSINNMNMDFIMKCRYRRALALYDLKKFDEAMKDTLFILQQDANNVPARALMGRSLKMLNQHHKAEEQLSMALALDENQATLYTERGDIRFRTGIRNKIIEAIYDFDKAVKILEIRLSHYKVNTYSQVNVNNLNNASTSYTMIDSWKASLTNPVPSTHTNAVTTTSEVSRKSVQLGSENINSDAENSATEDPETKNAKKKKKSSKSRRRKRRLRKKRQKEAAEAAEVEGGGEEGDEKESKAKAKKEKKTDDLATAEEDELDLNALEEEFKRQDEEERRQQRKLEKMQRKEERRQKKKLRENDGNELSESSSDDDSSDDEFSDGTDGDENSDEDDLGSDDESSELNLQNLALNNNDNHSEVSLSNIINNNNHSSTPSNQNHGILKTASSSSKNKKRVEISTGASLNVNNKSTSPVNNPHHTNTNVPSSNNNSNNSANVVISGAVAALINDLEEQLADTLYKRAQAKLLIEPDPMNITSALNDALRATFLVDEDDDYLLVAATCFIRLYRFSEAQQILEKILRRSPDNAKALYHMSFCARAFGNQKTAIEGLTKIIAYSTSGIHNTASNSSETSHSTAAQNHTLSNLHDNHDEMIYSALLSPVYTGIKSTKLLSNSVAAAAPQGKNKHGPNKSGHNAAHTGVHKQAAASGNKNIALAVPIYRVYEMRGTLFHELQAHKLSLMDLGKAIAINPQFPDNYYLRGDCHFKLGNYELALADLEQAERQGFEDKVTLYLSRGQVKRLLKDVAGAVQDFSLSLQALEAQQQQTQQQQLAMQYTTTNGNNMTVSNAAAAASSAGNVVNDATNINNNPLLITQVRVLSMIAFAQIDLRRYDAALEHLQRAQDIVQCKLQALIQSSDGQIIKDFNNVNSYSGENQEENSGYNFRDLSTIVNLNLSSSSSNKNAPKRPQQSSASKSNNGNGVTDEYLYLQRIAWVLTYHEALCYYMLQRFRQAAELMEDCLCEENVVFKADDLSLGNLHYFQGLAFMQLRDYQSAKSALYNCSLTYFKQYSSQNHFLLLFSMAKNYQCLREHATALQLFNECIKLFPQSAHALFRRAFTHKALGNFIAAGDDFETAKSLEPNNPNFSVEYRAISKLEYILINSDPDLVQDFPPLLPVPTLNIH